jgi:type II secretory pathway pseudopilin PulG
MAALLVAMSIMAIMMTVVMPVWKHAAQREKEEELIFRGKQYIHAIGLFQRKFANAYPPNIDILVEQRFLRKKFKDPITNDDFVPLPVGQGVPAAGLQQPGPRGQTPGGRGQTPTSPDRTPQTPQASGQRGASPFGATGTGGGTTAGVSGVTSKSKDQSIRLYNGRGHYNEWAFVYTPQIQQPGAGAPGSTVPGQVPGQRGQPNQPGQQQPGPFNPGQRGRGGFGNPTGGTGFPGTQQPPPGGRGFGPGQQTPIQPPSRGRL